MGPEYNSPMSIRDGVPFMKTWVPVTRIVSPGMPTRRLISTSDGSVGLRNTTTSPRCGMPMPTTLVFTTGSRRP